MTTTITIADLLAVQDVLDQVLEYADSASVESAYELRPLLTTIAKKASDAEKLLKAQLIVGLEGQPKVVGNTTLIPKDEGKWRPDQDRIRSLVTSRSLYNDEGSPMRTKAAVAGRAVDLMYSLFVSPSAMPKQSGLELIRSTNKDVASWERTGTKLVEVSMGSPDEDGG